MGLANGLVLACQPWPSNAELIADVNRLGYIKGRVLDPTFEGGIWWRIHRPANLTTLCRDLDGTDFRDLAQFPNRSFDTIAYDPPYCPQGSKTTTTMVNFNERYGRHVVPSSAESVQDLVNDGLTEMWRLVDDGGIVLCKAADHVWNNEIWLGTHWTLTHAIHLGFKVEERFEMFTDAPSPQPKLANCLHCGVPLQRRLDHETWTDRNRTVEASAVCRRPHPFRPHQPDLATPTQRHANRNLSSLFVLRKPTGKRPPQYERAAGHGARP